MSFRQKWVNLLYRVATGSRRVRVILAPLGALFFFTFVALFILLSHFLDTWLGLPKVFHQPYNIVISTPFLAIGLFLVLWCNILFIKAKGTPVPLNPPQSLVINGPYAFSRNPMLTGLFAILFGIGVVMNSICLMFVFTPLFVFLNTVELKYIEEPELEKRLGEPYIEYKKRIPMFIPKLQAVKMQKGTKVR